MNYHLTLVVGESASFLLEDWAHGGVAIADDVVGLFEGMKRSRELEAALDLYQAERVHFDTTTLLKVGLAHAWSWRRVGWEGEGPLIRRAAERINGLLSEGFPADRNRQVQLLKVIQAAAKTLGPPGFVDGVFTRPSGREDRIAVYASGAVRYDKTPHPLSFLQEISGVIRSSR